jgi:predicted dehydrogenase
LNSPLRIGLLGASRIAPAAVIAPATSDPRFAVVTVAASDPSRARAYAAEHALAEVSETYEGLVEREDLDIIYNALPPAGHARWSIAAVRAGKTVLCEKPFARDAQEAAAMTSAARAAGAILLEAFHYRFHAVMREAEALVRSGRLGRLVRAQARFDVAIPRSPGELRWSRAQGGGALMDLGTYPLHALRTLIGSEPEVLAAQASFDDGVDAQLDARLGFADGVEASLACSMIVERPMARLRLEGERATLEIVNFVAPQLGCRFTLEERGETHGLPTVGPSTYAAQLSHLYDVIHGGAPPLTGGEDAVNQMRAIDAIYLAAGRN